MWSFTAKTPQSLLSSIDGLCSSSSPLRWSSADWIARCRDNEFEEEMEADNDSVIDFRNIGGEPSCETGLEERKAGCQDPLIAVVYNHDYCEKEGLRAHPQQAKCEIMTSIFVLHCDPFLFNYCYA